MKKIIIVLGYKIELNFSACLVGVRPLENIKRSTYDIIVQYLVDEGFIETPSK